MSDIDALRARLIAKRHVNVAGTEGFDVGGISLDSILRIFRRHGDDLRDLFDRLAGTNGGGISLDEASQLGGALLGSAPQIAAELIAEAAGFVEAEAAELFLQLPAPVQVEALDRIAELTFTSEMPPKKVIETVLRHLKGVSLTLIGNAEAVPA
jgi:hypothetical protein